MLRRHLALAVVILISASPVAWSDPPERGFSGYMEGTVAVSLTHGTLTGHGTVVHGAFIGAAEWDYNLALTELVGEPLCRNAFGTLTFTTRSGAQLILAVIEKLCYDPNSRYLYNSDVLPELKIVGGTGRFASLTGRGYLSFGALLDDSGTTGAVDIGVNYYSITFERP